MARYNVCSVCCMCKFTNYRVTICSVCIFSYWGAPIADVGPFATKSMLILVTDIVAFTIILPHIYFYYMILLDCYNFILIETIE